MIPSRLLAWPRSGRPRSDGVRRLVDPMLGLILTVVASSTGCVTSAILYEAGPQSEWVSPGSVHRAFMESDAVTLDLDLCFASRSDEIDRVLIRIPLDLPHWIDLGDRDARRRYVPSILPWAEIERLEQPGEGAKEVAVRHAVIRELEDLADLGVDETTVAVWDVLWHPSVGIPLEDPRWFGASSSTDGSQEIRWILLILPDDTRDSLRVIGPFEETVRGNRALYVLTPVTVALDVLTAPLQLLVILAVAISEH